MFKWLASKLSSKVELPEKWSELSTKHIPFLAIDLELTGLDAREARILSIGWVEGKANRVDLGSCFYRVVHTKQSLEQSPVIHGLTEEDIKQGSAVREVIEALLPYADTHVWVFHNTALDMAVIKNTCEKLNLQLPEVLTLDTLQMALYLLQKSHQVMPPNAATLAACRQRHKLPLAPAHNALDDAMATIELLWAQLAIMDPQGNSTLVELTNTGAIKPIS